MTHHIPKRRPYARRFRPVNVTTARREQSPEQLARILTVAALGRAQREAEARADHQSRLTRGREPSSPTWLPEDEGASNA